MGSYFNGAFNFVCDPEVLKSANVFHLRQIVESFGKYFGEIGVRVFASNVVIDISSGQVNVSEPTKYLASLVANVVRITGVTKVEGEIKRSGNSATDVQFFFVESINPVEVKSVRSVHLVFDDGRTLPV